MANVSPQHTLGSFCPVRGGGGGRRGPASGHPESGTSELSAEDLNYGYFKAWYVLG